MTEENKESAEPTPAQSREAYDLIRRHVVSSFHVDHKGANVMFDNVGMRFVRWLDWVENTSLPLKPWRDDVDAGRFGETKTKIKKALVWMSGQSRHGFNPAFDVAVRRTRDGYGIEVRDLTRDRNVHRFSVDDEPSASRAVSVIMNAGWVAEHGGLPACRECGAPQVSAGVLGEFEAKETK